MKRQFVILALALALGAASLYGAFHFYHFSMNLRRSDQFGIIAGMLGLCVAFIVVRAYRRLRGGERKKRK